MAVLGWLLPQLTHSLQRLWNYLKMMLGFPKFRALFFNRCSLDGGVLPGNKPCFEYMATKWAPKYDMIFCFKCWMDTEFVSINARVKIFWPASNQYAGLCLENPMSSYSLLIWGFFLFNPQTRVLITCPHLHTPRIKCIEIYIYISFIMICSLYEPQSMTR